MNPLEQVQQSLSEEFPEAEFRLRTLDSGLVFGTVISRAFTGLSSDDRQERIDAALGRSGRGAPQVGYVIALTPDELRELQPA